MTRAKRFVGTSRFQILSKLGEGGMGGVYEVLDREQDKRVALKTLRNLDPKALLRFKHEYRALLDLRHPNLVRLGELIEEDGQWFFTMELIEGTHFYDYVRHGADETLDERRVRRSLAQLTRGLLALHAANQVHRDIKPSNIMVSRTGRVVLLDFGLAADASGDPIQSMHTLVGTSEFMAPEQAVGDAVGPAADWYSVGAVLFHAITGRYPFTGDRVDQLRRKQTEEPPPPRYLVPQVSAELNDLCIKLQRFEPPERIGGAEILAALGEPDDPREDRDEVVDVPFIGRREQLDLLLAAADEVSAGSPVVINIRGESGVGKSALVRELVAELAQSCPDSLILQGRCYHLESVPYKAIDHAVDQLAAYLGSCDPEWVAQLLPDNVRLAGLLFPVLRRVGPIAERIEQDLRTPPPDELRAEGFAAFRELVAAIAKHRLVAVIIDDMQWADADSKALLASVWKPPSPPPILGVFLTKVAGDAAAESYDWLPFDVRTLELGVLGDAAAARLASFLIERFAPPELSVDALVKSGRRHPFFMVELARYASVGSGHGVDVAEVLWRRISRLDARARRLLQISSIAAAPVPQGVAAAAADMNFAELVEVAEELHRRHLVTLEGVHPKDTIDVYHGLVRATVSAKLGDAERRDLHRALADALERDEDSERQAELLAAHLEAAGKPDRAARFCEQAAERASAQLAFERSASFYHRALRLGAYNRRKARTITVALAESLVNAGRAVEAVPYYLEAARTGNAADRLDCRRRAAEQLLVSGRIKRGVELFDDVLREIDEQLPPTPRRALMSLLWQRARLRLSGLRWQQRDESQLAPWDLVRLDALNAVARGLSMVDPIRGLAFQSRMLRLALKLGEQNRIAKGIALYAINLASSGTGAVPRAREVLSRAETVAVATQDPSIEAWVLAAKGFISYFSVVSATGYKLLEAASHKIRTEATGMSWELNSIGVAKMWALRQMGRTRVLARELDRAVDDASRRGDLYTETSVRRAANMVWLARDDPDGAERDLGRATWIPPEGQFHLQHYWELEARGQIVLYRRDAARALDDMRPQFAALNRSLIPRLQIPRINSRWLLARLLLAAHETAPDRALLREATAVARGLRKESIDAATVCALLIEAGVAAQHGDRTGLVAALERAVPLASGCDMELHAAVARYRLAQLIGGVTASEHGDAAEQWFGEQEIRNPEAFCATVAPGAWRYTQTP